MGSSFEEAEDGCVCFILMCLNGHSVALGWVVVSPGSYCMSKAL